MRSSLQKLLIVFIFTLINQSCTTEKPEELIFYDLKGKNSNGNEISIPDENFKYTLIKTACVDTDGDGIPDINADLNNDGVLQKNEANSVENLILHFDYGSPVKFVELEGIEHFGNVKSLKISGTGNYVEYTDYLYAKNLKYDFRGLRKLETIKITSLATEFFDSINLSGLSKLTEIDLSGNRPMDYYSESNQFITVNLEGCSSLNNLNITNSFLKIDFCQVPSLEKLNMMYLEGGEPETFDFHCLSNLKWLNITENRINTLNLKNSSVLDTLIINYPYADAEWFYPSPQQICIDDIQEEREQISPLIGEYTIVSTECSN